MTKKLKIALIVIVLSFIVIFAVAKIAISYAQKNSVLEHSFSVKKANSLDSLVSLTISPPKEEMDLPPKINFLILGNPGDGNNAPDLTDTIMLAVLKPLDKKIYFFSMPRDLYVRIGDTPSFSKINSLYYFSKIKNPDFPTKYPIDTVEKISGEKIDYFLTIDLSAIKQIVDDLGGLNVDVSETVIDPKLVNPHNENEIFRVEKGWRYFDGATTVKYLRTRYSKYGDFDRMRRQQDIVEAFRKKIFGLNLFWDFPKLIKLYSDLDEHITTNMDIASDAKPIWKTVKSIPSENLIYKVVDGKENNLVTVDNVPVENGLIASIVRPKAGIENYQEIHEFIQNTIKNY